MSSKLMPYGSQRLCGLAVKEGDPVKLQQALAAELATGACRATGGHLAKGGMEKSVGLDRQATRIIRLNARRP